LVHFAARADDEVDPPHADAKATAAESTMTSGNLIARGMIELAAGDVNPVLR
jgi:hypothetical protein